MNSGDLAPAAVLFDLLTGLLDSWTLWNRAAGSRQAGLRWRAEYLRRTYGAGGYRPYEELVTAAARAVGLPAAAAGDLIASWDDLTPWPEAREALAALRRHARLGVVTNCSDPLALRAVARLGVDFDVVVSAERAGWYKPRPEPYRLALDELALAPENVLFVAGSPADIGGAAAVGMRVFWHNRIGLSLMPDSAATFPVETADSLRPLIGTMLHR